MAWMERRAAEINELANVADEAVIQLAGAVLREAGVNSQMGELALNAINATLNLRVTTARTVADATAIAEMEAN